MTIGDAIAACVQLAITSAKFIILTDLAETWSTSTDKHTVDIAAGITIGIWLLVSVIIVMERDYYYKLRRR